MDARELKIKAAEAALSHVENGMRLGIGTGSTAEEFVRLLAAKVAEGFKVTGVPTSERAAFRNGCAASMPCVCVYASARMSWFST